MSVCWVSAFGAAVDGTVIVGVAANAPATVTPTAVVVVTAGEAPGDGAPDDAAPDEGVGDDPDPEPDPHPASRMMGNERHARRRREPKDKGTYFIRRLTQPGLNIAWLPQRR